MALVVITGGARSGKSGAAERLARRRQAAESRVVVAVFGHAAGGNDVEFAQRIARHRADRPQGFETIEPTPRDEWWSEVGDDALLVVDCLGTYLGRVMEDVWAQTAGDEILREADAATLPNGFEESCTKRFARATQGLAGRQGDTIVVTNEVGEGIVPNHASGRLFRDLLGQANRALVGKADGAYLAVAGRLLDLAALPAEAAWPED
jgi:adenosylcobinamide kinase / adenosylcobinamide-phosphate guanylyltransferase